MKRLVVGILLAVSVLVASCATGPGVRSDKQCSDTPHSAVRTFIEGIREFSLALLNAVIPENTSTIGVFAKGNRALGEKVVHQILEDPEVAGEKGCVCSLLSVSDTTDPQKKEVVVKREVVVGKNVHNYKWAFMVSFSSPGNCILSIDRIDKKWERIQ
ncbi:MAG: hypothetical protein Q7R93_04200 [bacterium]|nr:hypothetical protein [bacterium]